MIGEFEDKGYWQVMYFMVQPVGIMVEDLMIWVEKEVGVKDSGKCLVRRARIDADVIVVWTKRLGFLWVILWFSWTLPFMVAFQPSSWYDTFLLPSPTRLALELLSFGHFKSG
jgi:hypothetical protein